jgi:hypothetical protein
MDALSNARSALLTERRRLGDAELTALAALPEEQLGALAELAHEVRLAWCGDTVEVEGILSAKTGGCPEDCHFCSQSARFSTPVAPIPLLEPEEVRAAARETAKLGASEFCLVYAIRGPDERTLERILELVPVVQREGLDVAVSASDRPPPVESRIGDGPGRAGFGERPERPSRAEVVGRGGFPGHRKAFGGALFSQRGMGASGCETAKPPDRTD